MTDWVDFTCTEDVGATVARDTYGIPWVMAADPWALAFAQGAVTATDRAWQLDCEHRRMAGTTAEVFGETGVAWDTFARQLQLAETAQRCYHNLGEADQVWFAAYAAGVNRALLQGAREGGEVAAATSTVVPWQPWTPLGVMLSHNLFITNFPVKLFRGALHDAGLGRLADLLTGGTEETGGSNSWAVQESFHGGPMIAADPHRILEYPGCYQQIRLTCKDFDVAGLAFPGVPGVPHFGQNDHVSWAVTSGMVAATDLFREELETTPHGMTARGPDGPEPVSASETQIYVRGQDNPVTVPLLQTARGPVLTTVMPYPVSVRMMPRVLGRTGVEVTRRLMGARTATEAIGVLDEWVDPINRVVVADTSGAVMERHCGAAPAPEHATAIITPAWAEKAHTSGLHEWPPARSVTRVVAANERHPDTAPLNPVCCPTDRVERIAATLTTAPDATVAHMLELQADTVKATVPSWARLLPEFFDGWDGDMSALSFTAAAFARVRHGLVKALYAVSPKLPDQAGGVLGAWCDLRPWLGYLIDHADPEAYLKEIAPEESWADMVTAVGAAVAAQEPTMWGDLHRLRPYVYETPHLVGGGQSFITPGTTITPDYMDTEVAVGGDADTVCATSWTPGFNFDCTRASAARVVWVTEARDASRWVVPFGSHHRHHRTDQLSHWTRGRTIPVMATPAVRDDMEWHAVAAQPVGALVRNVVDTGNGPILVAHVRPDEDVDTIYRWATQDRAQFWRMGDHTQEQVQGIYEYLTYVNTHEVLLMWFGRTPIALVHMYDPRAEAVGEHYDVRDGDVGLHFMMAPREEFPRQVVPEFYRSLVETLFSDPDTRRVVVEPDARNTAAIKRAKTLGFVFEREIELPDKTARLGFLVRPE